MLWSIENHGLERITTIPHEREYRIWTSRLREEDIDAITREFERLVDESGKEVVTSSWLPGSDWSGTPFEPIYDTAARGDEEAAGKASG
jgi:hypothetical protein